MPAKLLDASVSVLGDTPVRCGHRGSGRLLLEARVDCPVIDDVTAGAAGAEPVLPQSA